MDWVLSILFQIWHLQENIHFLLIIPKGFTGKIQPLDVYEFRIWKNFAKRFSNIVLLLESNINLHEWNNIIKLQSLIYNQFVIPINITNYLNIRGLKVVKWSNEKLVFYFLLLILNSVFVIFSFSEFLLWLV